MQKFIFVKFFILFSVIFFSCSHIAFSKTLSIVRDKNCQAIVLGEMVREQVKKIGNYYITEYKLKTKKWFFKAPNLEKAKYLTVRILGAELPKKGIVIKASTSPDFIPLKREAVFFLENTSKKQKNIFTLSRDGVVLR